MKNKKGFTLIEIMIVIAIIGILAIVLIPRIGSMRDSAKLAGIDTNMRVAEGIAQSLLNSYAPAIASESSFETTLASKLATGDADKDASNPLTSVTGAGSVTAITTSGGAFAYIASDYTAPTTKSTILTDLQTTLTANGNPALKGVIYYVCFVDSADNSLKVTFIPIDQTGKAMAEKQVTLAK